MSHTGSLAGSDKLYSALFARLGIARCDTVTQFLETLKLVSIVGTLPSSTIGSMSCSGGEAAIVADNAEALGLDTPTFAAESVKKLQDLLGPNVDVANPLDYHLYVWGDYDKLNASFTEVLNNGFGCTLLSEMTVLRTFGSLACVAISSALIGDLVVLPALLLWRRRDGD